MAGQRPTLTEQREQQNHTENYSWMGTELVGKRYFPLFIAEVSTAVEYAAIRYTVANSATLTANLAYAANGTIVSTNTDITNTVNMNSTLHTNNVFTFKTANGVTGEVPNNNIVPAGATVLLELSDVANAALDGVVLTVRTTDKIH
jgi:hypothetical protein